MANQVGTVVLLCAAMIAVSGCQEPRNQPKTPAAKDVPRATSLRSHLGHKCTVQFRRDALGAGAPLPIPPTTGSINGAEVSLAGELTDVSPEGIVVTLLSNPPTDHWIPYSSILMVQITSPIENPVSSQQLEH